MSARARLRVAGLLLAGVLLGTGACDGSGDGRSAADPGEGAPPVPSAPRILGKLPRFGLVDENGERFGTEDVLGRLSVFSFIFTRCAGTCPEQTRHMAILQTRLLSRPDADRVRLVSVTVDPVYDVPAVLREYAAAAGADPSRWSFVTGDRDAIWRFSREGFHLDVGDDPGDSDMPIFHATKLVLVDSFGQVRGYYDGLEDAGVEELLGDLDLLHGEPRLVPPVDETLDTSWMDERAAVQREALDASDVAHAFSFTDRVVESGITFVNRVVPDAGKDYVQVHYDHGNGVSVADVDGDGLLDLYFTNQVGGNELWRNLGEGRFEDVTESAGGLALADRISVTSTFADLDDDGDPDLYVTAVRDGNVLFRNDGGRFTDVTPASGLGYRGHSSAAVPFDFDRDGRLDILLANVGVYTKEDPAPATEDADAGGPHYYPGYPDAFAGHLKPERTERTLLFHNDGNLRFTDVSDAVGLDDASWTGDATPLDVNDDGWLDLYLLDMQGHDEYWENEAGKRFVRRTLDVFPRTPWGAMGVKWFDFDGDGRLDLYVTDMHSDMARDLPPDVELEGAKSAGMLDMPDSLLRSEGRSIYGNAFFLARPDGSFEEVSDSIGAENYWPWGFSVADLNADGFLDVFVCASMNLEFRYHPNLVLLNDSGRRLVDAAFVLGVEPRRDGRTTKEWFRLAPETELRDVSRNRARRVDGSAVYWDALGSRSSVVFDLDGDGDLDVVTNDFGSEPMVLVSDLAERDESLSYLFVALVGTKSNRDGLGARVTVTAGGRDRVQVHDGKSGYLSHGSAPLYFGLGGAATVDRIVIRWPSGATQTVEGPIEPRQRIVVTED